MRLHFLNYVFIIQLLHLLPFNFVANIADSLPSTAVKKEVYPNFNCAFCLFGWSARNSALPQRSSDVFPFMSLLVQIATSKLITSAMLLEYFVVYTYIVVCHCHMPLYAEDKLQWGNKNVHPQCVLQLNLKTKSAIRTFSTIMHTARRRCALVSCSTFLNLRARETEGLPFNACVFSVQSTSYFIKNVNIAKTF